MSLELGLKLKTFGLRVCADFLASNLNNLTFDQATTEILNADLRKKNICDPCLPDDISASDGCISGYAVLQIVSVSNISQPSHAQSDNTQPCTLQIKLTDGHSKSLALCMESIANISTNCPPGSKIRLGPDVKYLSGRILLNNSNCVYLGGTVPSLIETWKANKYALSLRKAAGFATKAGQGPPKFDFKLSSRSSNIAVAPPDNRVKKENNRIDNSKGKHSSEVSNMQEMHEKTSTAAQRVLMDEASCARAIDVKPTRGKQKAVTIKDESIRDNHPQSVTHVIKKDNRNPSKEKGMPSIGESVERQRPSTAEGPNAAAKRMISKALGNTGRGSQPHDSGRDREGNREKGSRARDDIRPFTASESRSSDSANNRLCASREVSIDSSAWPALESLPAAAPETVTMSQKNHNPGSWGQRKETVAAVIEHKVPPTMGSADARGGINLMDFAVRKPNKISGSRNKEISVTWICGTCTFENHCDLIFCEMCSSPRQKIKVKTKS